MDQTLTLSRHGAQGVEGPSVFNGHGVVFALQQYRDSDQPVGGSNGSSRAARTLAKRLNLLGA
jgi:hypothetical protein